MLYHIRKPVTVNYSLHFNFLVSLKKQSPIFNNKIIKITVISDQYSVLPIFANGTIFIIFDLFPLIYNPRI